MSARSTPWKLLSLVVLAACSGGGGGGGVDATAVDAEPDAPVDAAVDAPVDAPPPPTPVPFDPELGHQTVITGLQRTATRALSVDSSGHWALWNLGTRALVAKGDRACPVGQACREPAALLAGDTVLVRGMPNLEVRSATTGALLASIPSQVGLDTPGSGLALDGSYVWATTTAAVRAWSPAGLPRVEVTGNYLGSSVFAAASELRITRGPAGAALVERIALATGARTTLAPDGVFAFWFPDGARFVTTSSNLVRVYDAAGVPLSAAVLPTVSGLDGQGDRLWYRTRDNFNEVLHVHQASNLAAAPTPIAIPLDAIVVNAPGALGVLDSFYGRFDTVALDTLATTRVEGLPCGLVAFGAGGGAWMVGTLRGAVLTGLGATVERPLARGELTALSGTVGGLAAVATAAGQVELVEVDDTPMAVRTLPYQTSHVELSTDGSTLVVTEDLTSLSCRPSLPVRVVATASAAVLHQWPYPAYDTSGFTDVSVARTALTVAHLLFEGGGYTRTLTTSTGTVLPAYGPPLAFGSSGMSGLLLFSPGGQRAASVGSYVSIDQAFTQLFDAGAQRAIVDGFPLGWLDDDRLLLVRYVRNGNQYVPTTTVRQVDGTVLATPAVPELNPYLGDSLARVRGHITPVGQGQFYARRKNAVYDLATAAQVWSGPSATSSRQLSEPAGDHVLYVAGTAVQVVRFRP